MYIDHMVTQRYRRLAAANGRPLAVLRAAELMGAESVRDFPGGPSTLFPCRCRYCRFARSRLPL
jgi:hypothetical protein